MRMKKRIETGTVLLPAYWASALINDDYSGLSDEEEDAIERFLIEYKEWYVADCSEESEFVIFHDARKYGVLAGDCLTYTLIRR
jgi:hypothetical protein